MEDYFKKISNILSRTSLTERERIDMRLHLAAFVDEHPAIAPFSIRLWSRISNVFGSSHLHFGSRAFAAALVLVLVAGIGTSYAAQTALPGSPLYTLKIAVNEPIEHATVASNQSGTQWDVTLASRRLEEAEKLAASGTLTKSSAAVLQKELNADTQDFNQQVTALAISSTDIAEVADAQSDFEAALSAHVQVLANLASSTSAANEQVGPLLALVRTHAAHARAARIAAIETLDVSSTSASVEIAASGERRAAAASLVSVRKLAANAASSTASSSVQIDTEEAIKSGDTNLAAGHFKAAFSAFQSAVRVATEAQVDAHAQSNLGVNVTLSSVVPADTATTTPIATSTPPNAAASSTTDDLNSEI